MRAQTHADTSILGELIKTVPKAKKTVAEDSGIDFALLTQPAWKPGATVPAVGCGVRYLPPAKRVMPNGAPGLAPQWRKLKKLTLASDFGDLYDGEYIPARPAYLDPIGAVFRRAPVYSKSPKIHKPPSQQLLKNRATLRLALSLQQIDSDLVAQVDGVDGPRLCWDSPPKSMLRFRIPQALVPGGQDEVDLEERHVWR